MKTVILEKVIATEKIVRQIEVDNVLVFKVDRAVTKIEIKEDEGVKISEPQKSKIKSKYSIEYLKKMISGSKLASNVKIRFNNDYPLKLDYTETDKVQLSFILAPRVEND